MNNEITDFEMIWNRFETSIKGKLLEKMQTQSITISHANILLKNVSANWFDMYDISGKWLIEYTKENPEKGNKINNILKNELKFSREAKWRIMPKYLKAIILLCGAIAGYILAILTKQNTIRMKLLIIILPLGVLYYLITNYEKQISENSKKIIINNYVKQLNEFKNNINKILNN
jgi:hypothetical protein